jgi:hypothetical protein
MLGRPVADVVDKNGCGGSGSTSHRRPVLRSLPVLGLLALGVVACRGRVWFAVPVPVLQPSHEQLRAAMVGLGWGSGSVVPVDFDGARGWAVVQVDLVEHRRRAAIGIAYGLSPALLGALWELPAHVEVPWDVLSVGVREVLGCAPPGVVVHRGAVVVREWFPPVRVVGAFVAPAARWRNALGRAGRFAALAPPVVLVEAERPPAGLILEASWFGIGVLAGFREAVEVVVPPGRRRGVPCCYHWEFAEAVYEAWVRVGAAAMPSAS